MDVEKTDNSVCPKCGQSGFAHLSNCPEVALEAFKATDTDEVHECLLYEDNPLSDEERERLDIDALEDERNYLADLRPQRGSGSHWDT